MKMEQEWHQIMKRPEGEIFIIIYENLLKNMVGSLFKEASHKGDLNAKLFYVVYLLKNANYEDRDEDFVEASFILQEIVAKDPNMGEAYFYLGYLYENGTYIKSFFLNLYNFLGFGVDQNLSYALNYYKI